MVLYLTVEATLRWKADSKMTLAQDARELCFTYRGATIRLIYKDILEEEVMADRDGSSFVWFLAGLGVGAVVGVLYAPRSGDEMREAIRSRAQEGSENARQQARRAREQASEWVDRGQRCDQ